jgi:hypothetical protein
MTTGIQAAISGAMYIAGEAVPGDAAAFYGCSAADVARLEPAFRNGSSALIARAAQLAAEASGPYRSAPVGQRARFLELAADEIDAAGPGEWPSPTPTACSAWSTVPTSASEGSHVQRSAVFPGHPVHAGG